MVRLGLTICSHEKLTGEVKGFVPWLLSFSLTYADGTVSPVYDYPYFVASTPRQVTQDLQALYKIPYGLHSTNENATQVCFLSRCLSGEPNVS